VLVEARQLLMEGGVVLRVRIGLLEIEHERHQRLGDEAPAEDAEAAVFVRAGAAGEGQGGGGPVCSLSEEIFRAFPP
jgi:hypothetical protein